MTTQTRKSIKLVLGCLSLMVALQNCSPGLEKQFELSGTITSQLPGSAKTGLHYASGLSSGALGFNLADVSDVATLNALPNNLKGLVWLGMCNGVDNNFINTVNSFIGNPKLYGFYLMDEPDPTGIWSPLCPAANLRAESDYIHSHLPGAVTFVVLVNLGTNANPSYSHNGLYYNQVNTHVDYFGIDAYPCLSEYGTNQCNLNVITMSVAAVNAVGVSNSQIIPVYQAYGCTSANGAAHCADDVGGYTFVPSSSQLQQMIDYWVQYTPNPAFDYAYTWNVSDIQYPLSQLPNLQSVLAAHNK